VAALPLTAGTAAQAGRPVLTVGGQGRRRRGQRCVLSASGNRFFGVNFAAGSFKLVPAMAGKARFYWVDAEWFAAEFASCFRANHAITEENNLQACLRYLRVADRDYRLGPAPLQRRRVISWLLSAGALAVWWLVVRPLVDGVATWLRLAFDFVLVLTLIMTVLQGLWLGWHCFWPKAHVAISQAALEEGLPSLAAKLEKHYDMTFLRGLYNELVEAAKKHPVRERR
jgi:hypothetical protein